MEGTRLTERRHSKTWTSLRHVSTLSASSPHLSHQGTDIVKADDRLEARTHHPNPSPVTATPAAAAAGHPPIAARGRTSQSNSFY